jgi:hypothetical protein
MKITHFPYYIKNLSKQSIAETDLHPATDTLAAA